MRKLVLICAVLAACTPTPPPVVNPVLPGDGAEHTAKPPPLIVKPVIEDPWAGKDLIPPPTPRHASKAELPALEEYTLKNGLHVYAIKSDRLPVISFQMAVRVGRDAETRQHLGVSELTADLLVKGTTKHDAKAIAAAIDQVGGTFTADSTFEATLLACSVQAKDSDTCLTLMPEIVATPTFPEQEVVKQRDQLIGGIRQRLDDGAALASLHVQNLLWGDNHVRGWINSEHSIGNLRREDLVTWHKTWYKPNNAMLVVAGDFDSKKMRDRLERAFGGWAKADVPKLPTYVEPGLSGIRIRLVDKPGQTQTHIRVAQFGIKHDDLKFFDTVVWNYVLGGGLGSRMMHALRTETGKAYQASTSFDRNADRGSLVAQTFAHNSDAVAATKLIVAEMQKMQKEGPTDEELAAAESNIAGAWGMRFQSVADLGGALLGAELHGYGMEYLQNYGVAISKVDLAGAKAAAASIIDPKNYVIVMVGDAKDLEPQMKKEGWHYEKLAFTDPITAETKDVAPTAPLVEDAKTAAMARKIVEEAVAAKGGAKLAGMKAFRMSGKGTTSQQGQTIDVSIERTLVVPDNMRIDAKLKTPIGDISVIVGVTGASGWQLGPDPKQPTSSIVIDIPAKDMTGVQFDRWRDPEMILLHALDKDAKLQLLPDESVDGKPQQVITVTSPFGGIDVTIYLDKKTHLMTRMIYAEGLTSTDDFADYHEVSGIKIAYTRNSHDASRDTKLTLDKVEIDPTVDASRFTKPEGTAPAPKGTTP
jgi:zinc protease